MDTPAASCDAARGEGLPTAAQPGSGGAPRRPPAFSFESLGQGTSYGARGRGDDEPSVVVGVIEEIEEIPQMPKLSEEIPFVGDAVRAGLLAPEQDNDDGGPELEFIYDAEVDQEEMTLGEEQAWACIEPSKYGFELLFCKRNVIWNPHHTMSSVTSGDRSEVCPEVAVAAATC